MHPATWDPWHLAVVLWLLAALLLGAGVVLRGVESHLMSTSRRGRSPRPRR